MRTQRRLTVFAALAAPLSLALAAPLGAQSTSGSVSLEARSGYVFLKDNVRGTAFAADLGLGSLGSHALRPFVGASYWHTNRMGNIKSTGGRIGLRLEVPPGARFAPFLHAAATAGDVQAETGSALRNDELKGFKAGADVGAGFGLAFDNLGHTRLVVEGRRTFIKQLNHWGVTAGFRITPRGEPTILAARDALLRAEQDRIAAEQRALAERERERLEAEKRAAAERERLEGERAAAERERLAAERDRASAEAAAREADQRAAAAERRAYDALVELDRLIRNITGVRETARGLVVTLGQGLFATGQSTLSAQARSEVDRIATVLQQFPNHRIAVEGHTDSTGSDAINQRLSLQRAQAVHGALVEAGISESRLDVAGFAATQPVADNATAAGRAENRRVEIIIVGARRPVAAN